MKNWFKFSISILIFILLIIFSVIYINRANLYTNFGAFYTKKNNYGKAQEYYEKAYLLGNTNKKFRENYVNLLINSPLTIEAQERLVDIAEDKISDTASESAKYFLFNLKREINNRYPDNYIKQAPYNQKIVHWGKIPITYSFRQTKNVPDDIVSAVNEAFDTWERASSARIRFEKTSINANIVVNFTQSFIKNPKLGEKYIIAYTIPDIAQDRLNRMDMVLNIVSIDGKPFTPNQMYNTALHEIFHALGFMGHSFNKSDIMYLTQDNDSIVTDSRITISDADKYTLELLYKIKPDITNAQELKYDYIPYPVLGDNAEVNYAKTDEAKHYIKKAPRVPAGYIDLAQSYMNNKNYLDAIKNLEKAYYLAYDSDTKYITLYNLAVANYYEKCYELSLFYIKKAIEIKDTEELHLLSPNVYNQQNDDKNAIREYERLIRFNPDNIEYSVNLANIYIKQHKYLKARKILKDYIKRNPTEKNNPRFSPCKILLL